MDQQKNKYKCLLADIAVISWLTVFTLLLLEAIKVGFVSNTLNINIIIITAIVFLTLSLIFPDKSETVKLQRYYYISFILFILLLMTHLIVSSTAGIQGYFLAILLSFCILLITYYYIYDRRSKNKGT